MTTFRARARTVDLLGRQQIRGVGTALSELLKNAYDAYAKEARIDLFRDRAALLIRDDGVGMSRADFEDRWLTLGTESKVDLRRPGVAEPPPGMPPRVMLGEKGIGRLAVAATGRVVLVLTRRPDPAADTVGALVAWPLFEIPGINLDQIDIPLATLPAGVLPSAEWVRILLSQVLGQLDELGLSRPDIDRISADLRAFPVDLVDLAHRLPGPILAGGGTHFLIAPVDESVIANLAPTDDEPVGDLLRTLIGFASPLDPAPKLATSFWDRAGPGQSQDLLAREEFWTPADLDGADHAVQGTFDEYGTFRGTVRVYERELAVDWPRPGPPAKVASGPFTIRFGYLQGRRAQSRLDADAYATMELKLEAYAGLYVYRDGLRIQPYGDHRFDWLDIERNRTKSASYYFFSYRRLFGLIELNRADNAALVEKAGREGFTENAAYREFRRVLRDLFMNLAAEFFREGGERSESFIARRSELVRENAARKARDRDLKERRKAYLRLLREKHRAILTSGRSQVALGSIERATRASIAVANDRPAVEEAGLVAAKRLRDLESESNLDGPEGFALEADEARELEAFRLDSGAFLKKVAAAGKRISAEVAARASAMAPIEGTSVTIEQRIRDTAHEEARTDLGTATEELFGALRDADARLRAIATDATRRADADATADPHQAEMVRNEIMANSRLLRSLADSLSRVDLTRDDDGIVFAPGELDAAADAELLQLRDQLEQDLELAQIGLAIEVIGHEFRGTVVSIREGLDVVEAWGKRNPELATVHRRLAGAFDHLDNYLTLLTPLQRRRSVAPTEISCKELHRFLADLFVDRIAASRIRFEATPAFLRHTFTGRVAVFYPAFINLVDNAAFWLERRAGERVIRLDRIGERLIVEDSGPGIPARDRRAVFEPGFTRKPQGRGLGLYITRQVLERNESLITLDGSTLGGARFVIEPNARAATGVVG